MQTDGPAHFAAEGNQQIAAVRGELQSLRKSDLSIYEIQERADALHTELQDALAAELVSAGPPPDATPEPTAASSGPAPAEPTAAEPPEPAAQSGTSTTEPATTDSSGDDATETVGSPESVPSDPSASSVPAEPSGEDATGGSAP